MAVEKSKELFEFKKQLQVLSQYQGRGTELISVYVTPNYPISDIVGKLRDEYGQAANIKSKTTQKNVQAALEKIMQYLKGVPKAPENGLALFAGNVSEYEGKVDVQLFAIQPPVPLTTQFYRCESRFVLDPLEDLVENTDSYGLVVLDGKEATIGILKGKQIKVIRRLNSTAHQKVSKGGQCIHEDELTYSSDGNPVKVKEIFRGTDVACIDFASHKSIFSACSNVFKRTSSESFELQTKNPKLIVKATGEHLFFVISEKGIVEKSVNNLQLGDRLVAVKKLLARNAEYISLSNNVPLSTPVLTASGRQLLLNLRTQMQLKQSDVANAISTDQMSISELERGEANFKEHRLSRLLTFFNLDQKEFYLKFVSRDPKFKLPKVLNEEFAQMLGYFIGDGTYDGNRIIFYDPNLTVLEFYKNILERVFEVSCIIHKVERKGYFELRAYNKYFVDYLAGEFSETCKKGVPKQVVLSPLSVKNAFVRGLFDAEGTASSNRISIAMANKEVIYFIHSVLLQNGIIASIGPKKSLFSQQYSIDINDNDSLLLFANEIGFSSQEKQQKLRRIMADRSNTNYSNQIPINGKHVSAFAKRLGLKHCDFNGLQSFLCGSKNISRKLFKEKILPVFKDRLKTLQNYGEDKYGILNAEANFAVECLEKIYDGDLIPVTLVKKSKINLLETFYDLTIPNNENFIVNGLVVHNSAQRYARLHIEAVEYYYKRIGEAMDAFLEFKNLKGVIVGGPGPTKESFMREAAFNHQLKVMGVVDTGYTDEYGLRELLEKSGELIAEQESIVEKKLLDEFMREIAKGGLATYGYTSVKEALAAGRISKLLVSEELILKEMHLRCQVCNFKEKRVVITKQEENKTYVHCDKPMMVDGEENLLLELEAHAEAKGIPVELISVTTAEGFQFQGTFGGLGAFLKY